MVDLCGCVWLCVVDCMVDCVLIVLVDCMVCKCVVTITVVVYGIEMCSIVWYQCVADCVVIVWLIVCLIVWNDVCG